MYPIIDGNNIGARSLHFLTSIVGVVASRAIYLVFADLVFSGVKSLSRNNSITIPTANNC